MITSPKAILIELLNAITLTTVSPLFLSMKILANKLINDIDKDQYENLKDLFR